MGDFETAAARVGHVHLATRFNPGCTCGGYRGDVAGWREHVEQLLGGDMPIDANGIRPVAGGKVPEPPHFTALQRAQILARQRRIAEQRATGSIEGADVEEAATGDVPVLLAEVERLQDRVAEVERERDEQKRQADKWCAGKLLADGEIERLRAGHTYPAEMLPATPS